MARPRETFNKKELQKTRAKKKKDKEQKKEERKANTGKAKTLEDMFVYVDAYGNLVATPPDPRHRIDIKVEDIQISPTKKEDIDPASLIRKGTVTFFNDSKGYGFIRDHDSQESIFVHINDVEGQIKEKDKVSFETERGVKGLNAVRVKLTT